MEGEKLSYTRPHGLHDDEMKRPVPDVAEIYFRRHVERAWHDLCRRRGLSNTCAVSDDVLMVFYGLNRHGMQIDSGQNGRSESCKSIT